jgi:hypothetical protein
MPDPEPIFSHQFHAGQRTQASDPQPTPAAAQPEQQKEQTQALEPKPATPAEIRAAQQIEQEVKKYGTGKPKRVVIKAKIIND